MTGDHFCLLPSLVLNGVQNKAVRRAECVLPSGISVGRELSYGDVSDWIRTPSELCALRRPRGAFVGSAPNSCHACLGI